MDEHKIDRLEEEKIDLIRVLQEFWRAFRRLFWVPLILAVLLAGLMGLRSWRSYTPMYAAEVTFTIQMADNALTDIAGSTNYYNKATAEQLAKSFPHIIQSDLLQGKLRQELGGGALPGTVTASTVGNTNMFTLRAASADPQAAYDLLTTVIRVYPQVADYVIGATNMQLLTEPTVPTAPYNSFDPMGSAAKGAVLGVLLGLLAVLAYAFTRRSIRETEEIRTVLNQHSLATLPQVSFKRRSKSNDQSVTIQNPKISGSFQESVRSMRIKFLREMEKQRGQMVMVTSTLPGEGKTTVAVNLALTLSQNGARVILVDLDLRKPSVKKALGVKVPSSGVPELLASGDEPRDYLIPVEDTRLRLLAGDLPVEDIRQQIGSRRLASLLAALREEADFIVLDTPPCGILADSAALARLADCSVYVVRCGVAQVSHVLDSLQFLGESGTRMLGCVLNGVQHNRSSYGYGYGYGYGGYSGKYGARRKKTEERD